MRRGRVVVVFLVASLLFLPETAGGATPDISFSGSGWGHGVGLSQYGAKAMAADGATYEQIIYRYFTGVSVVPLSAASPGTYISTNPSPVWVGLLQDQPGVTFTVSEDSAQLCFDDPNLCVRSVGPGETWRFGPDALGSCVFQQARGDGRFVPFGVARSCSASVRPTSAATKVKVPFKARSYRDGTLRFRPSALSGRLHVVFETGLETYLRGVSEVPESWPRAAIEAQVVTTRSATAWHLLDRGAVELFTSGSNVDCFCNLRDGGSDPVFRGASGADSNSNWVAAVEATRSQVIRAGTGVALGMYSSSSGGITEDYADVFGDSTFTHLVSVADSAAFSDTAGNPHSQWAAGYNQQTLANAFGFTWVSNLRVSERNESGSARTVLIEGIIDGRPASELVTGVDIQTELALRSTSFDVMVKPAFDDVPPGHQFAGEVVGLADLGITAGCTPTLFCPENRVTRGEMAAFLVRALDLDGPTGPDSFEDDDSSLFETDIQKIYAHGITTGCAANRFCPDSPVSRGEMAAFLVRAFGLVGDGGNTFTDDDGSFFESDIAALEASRVTSGCGPGLFCPTRSVSRQEMAAFLIRALALA
ncbi:MAG: S-layer homology domain-containing protein [Actinomycetota bacterium]|nr:S-layer homology domain-containing protein [Actinomycetota bacterium]